MGKGVRNHEIRKHAENKGQARKMRKYAKFMKQMGMRVKWS